MGGVVGGVQCPESIITPRLFHDAALIFHSRQKKRKEKNNGRGDGRKRKERGAEITDLSEVKKMKRWQSGGFIPHSSEQMHTYYQ